MTDNSRTGQGGGMHRAVIALVGLAVLLVALFTPVRAWLNGIPYLWHVLYVMLTALSGYLCISSYVLREGRLDTAKWAVLCVSGAAAAVHAFGGGAIFFTIGRWGVILFLVVEVVQVVVDLVKR